MRRRNFRTVLSFFNVHSMHCSLTRGVCFKVATLNERMMYRVVEGQVSAWPFDNFLTRTKKEKKENKTKNFQGLCN